MKDTQNQKWSSRDWKWLTGILIGIICFLVILFIVSLSVELSTQLYIINTLSISSSIVSILLGLVAIFYAFIQNNSASRSIERISSKVDQIDNIVDKIISISKSVDRIEKISLDHIDKRIADEKDRNNNKKSVEGSKDLTSSATVRNLQYTRVHFNLYIKNAIDIQRFVEFIKLHFKTKNKITIEDYSLKIKMVKTQEYYELPIEINGIIIIKKVMNHIEARSVFTYALVEALEELNVAMPYEVEYIYTGNF